MYSPNQKPNSQKMKRTIDDALVHVADPIGTFEPKTIPTWKKLEKGFTLHPQSKRRTTKKK